MDNQNSAFNLDPDQITTQGVVTSSQALPTPQPKVLDITPSEGGTLTLSPNVSHIDEATLPDHKVLDITPPVSDADPPTPSLPADPPVTAPPLVSSTPADSSLPNLETPLDPVLPPLPTPTGDATPASSPVIPASPTAATPATTGFQIDTSSPLYEDPDKINLPK